MLGVAWEDGVYVADGALDEIGGEDGLPIAPHAFDKHGVVTGQLSLCAEDISEVYLGLEMTLEEVLGEGEGVGKTLQATVHETGVA